MMTSKSMDVMLKGVRGRFGAPVNMRHRKMVNRMRVKVSKKRNSRKKIS